MFMIWSITLNYSAYSFKTVTSFTTHSSL